MKENEVKTQKSGAGSIVKKILNIIVSIMIVLVLIISITIAVMSISSKDKGVSIIFGHTVEIVQTDSMKGGSDTYEGGDFVKGDVILSKYVGNSMLDETEYQVGDIVTYKGDLDGDPETKEQICHRIIEVAEYQGYKVYRTMGDSNLSADQQEGDYASYITNGDITSVFYTKDYHGKVLKGVGNALNFIQSKLGFFLCILLPMIIFFLYELIRVIFNFAYYKKAKEEESSKKAEEEKKAEIEAAVAAALAEKDQDSSAEKEKDEPDAKKDEELSPENMTPEQLEQFKKFLESQKKEQDSE